MFENICFDINIIKLERIFAAEFYYVREQYFDTSKHLYDISILFENEKIQNMLNNKSEFLKLVNYKREEEKARLGGISDFKYLHQEFNEELKKSFKDMQDKYIFKEEYKINFDVVERVLSRLLKQIK